MTATTFSDSIVIARSPAEVYDLVSDVTRMGEWSPICRACWWDEGAGPQVGAWFTGRNETPSRTWETRSQVVVADPGREFAFTVGKAYVRWAYLLEPAGTGTALTEAWEFLPAGLAFFAERFGPTAPQEIAERTEAARQSIPATLRALRDAAESGGPAATTLPA